MLAPPPPPRRSTSRGFQSLDLLISGFLQDVGFQIPDFQICTPHAFVDHGAWGARNTVMLKKIQNF